ncbi:slr1659 superfamily regulator [Coleofasciculus sp.]|uniref:slr1659 superfamily regulator n=1 Tax=Coleofasciculus sp. TaxID=3100458 RepID=UPI003A3C2A91
MKKQNVQGENYQVIGDIETATVYFEGSLRLGGMKEYEPIIKILDEMIQQDHSLITLNLRELEFLNSSGISMLSKFVLNVRKKKTIQIEIKGSDKIPWQGKSLKNLQRLMPGLKLELE